LEKDFGVVVEAPVESDIPGGQVKSMVRAFIKKFVETMVVQVVGFLLALFEIVNLVHDFPCFGLGKEALVESVKKEVPCWEGIGSTSGVPRFGPKFKCKGNHDPPNHVP